jgi:hypothetical protein
MEGVIGDRILLLPRVPMIEVIYCPGIRKNRLHEQACRRLMIYRQVSPTATSARRDGNGEITRLIPSRRTPSRPS